MASKQNRQRHKVKSEAEWEALVKEDPIEALQALQKRLETLSVLRSYKWDDYLYAKLPTSLLPKTVKNAEVINAILVKSWEIQGSHCPKIPGSGPLADKKCVTVHAFLMYYFKSMNIADNMKRIIGSLDRKNAFGFGAFVHSFLKIGDHNIIDNTFNLESMEHWNNIPFKMFEGCSASKYNDGDPADPKFGVLPQSSEIGLQNERLLYGNDEKVEQTFVLQAAAQNVYLETLTMYDTEMRKFIKEKYGFEIENLAKKWSRLCWNCFAAVENLKKCSKCRTSRYCGKDCQVQDWKITEVHKIHHAMLDRYKID